MTRVGRLERIGLAALAGALATGAATQSPLLSNIAPIAPLGVPLDLRVLLLPLLFAGAQTLAPRLGWPAQGLTTLGLAILVAILNHAHASATLTFGNVPWAIPGTRVPLVAFALTLTSVLIGLFITLHAGHERFQQRSKRRGLDPESLQPAKRVAQHLTRVSLTIAALAATGLALTMRIVDQLAAGAKLPLAEGVALGILLAFGAILLGLDAKDKLRIGR